MERTVELDTHLNDWVDLLGAFWCRHFHDSVMWPIHGEYECRSCGRRHSVPWDPRRAIRSSRQVDLMAASELPCTASAVCRSEVTSELSNKLFKVAA
jgi:hypothetical protein